MNNEYYNYAIRHMELLNSIVRQLNTVNQNMSHYLRQHTQHTQHTQNTNRTRMSTPQRSYSSRRPVPTNNSHTLARETQQDRDVNTLATSILNSLFWEPVAVYLTEEEISSATSRVEFSDLPDDATNCPITLESFNENSEILRINACGHCFTRNGILRWFRNHVNCPVCRHDIRGSAPSTEANTNSSVSSQNISSATDTNIGDSASGNNNQIETIEFDFTLNPNITSNIMTMPLHSATRRNNNTTQ